VVRKCSSRPRPQRGLKSHARCFDVVSCRRRPSFSSDQRKSVGDCVGASLSACTCSRVECIRDSTAERREIFADRQASTLLPPVTATSDRQDTQHRLCGSDDPSDINCCIRSRNTRCHQHDSTVVLLTTPAMGTDKLKLAKSRVLDQVVGTYSYLERSRSPCNIMYLHSRVAVTPKTN